MVAPHSGHRRDVAEARRGPAEPRRGFLIRPNVKDVVFFAPIVGRAAAHGLAPEARVEHRQQTQGRARGQHHRPGLPPAPRPSRLEKQQRKQSRVSEDDVLTEQGAHEQ
jgi:hypothetical protein